MASAVLAGAALASHVAMAESTVNVPFSFKVDGKICPAGQYSVERDSQHNTVILRSKQAPIGYNWILTTGDENRASTDVRLKFSQNDRDFTLQSVDYGRQSTHRLDGAKHTSRDLERIVQGQ